MPSCRKCNTTFSIIYRLDGKKHNLKNRKYCLDCSPFKNHNTLKLEEIDENNGLAKICSICKRVFEYSRKAGHRTRICNSCSVTTRYKKVKEKCIEYKGGKCIDCGYSKSISALEFHHLDASTKEFNIGGHHNRKWNSIKQELDKCVLVCANCHRERHDEITMLAWRNGSASLLHGEG